VRSTSSASADPRGDRRESAVVPEDICGDVRSAPALHQFSSFDLALSDDSRQHVPAMRVPTSIKLDGDLNYLSDLTRVVPLRDPEHEACWLATLPTYQDVASGHIVCLGACRQEADLICEAPGQRRDPRHIPFDGHQNPRRHAGKWRFRYRNQATSIEIGRLHGCFYGMNYCAIIYIHHQTPLDEMRGVTA
jgi:hypothetical protein